MNADKTFESVSIDPEHDYFSDKIDATILCLIFLGCMVLA